MQFYSIFLFFYIFRGEEDFSKNCYFYNNYDKYLFDCRKLQLSKENCIDTLYKDEQEKIIKGELCFNFQEEMNIKSCKNMPANQSVVFVPTYNKDQSQPCIGLMSAFKEQLQIVYMDQEIWLQNKENPSIKVHFICSKVAIALRDPHIELQDDTIHIISKYFCGEFQRNAMYFQKFKIIICSIFFISSILICLNGLFHDNLIKCLISVLLGYFFVSVGINIFKTEPTVIEMMITHSIALLTAVFFLLLVIQFKAMYKSFMGFLAGFIVFSLLINLIFPYKEELEMYLYTWIGATLTTIASLFLGQNFIQAEICLIGSFMFVYSIFYVFLKEYTAFEYNIMIKSGRSQEAKDFVVFAIVWIVFIFYWFIEYKIRKKKEQNDFKNAHIIV